MKKVTILMMCALAVTVFSSCGSKKSAAEAARSSHEKLMNKDYGGYVETIYFGEVIPPVEVDAHKAEHARILERQAAPVIEAKGGLVDIAVKEEALAPDKKTADVTLTHTYGDGTQQDVIYAMVLDEPTGDWKIHMGPNREVWRTRLPDGTHETFKLIETDHREVEKIHIGDERDFAKEIDGNHRQVEKVMVDGEREVEKVIEHRNETVIKEKVDGEREVTHIPNE